MLGSYAHPSRLFDIMAKLWYGEIISHHYLPLRSLFRVGVSLFHIHNNKTAGENNRADNKIAMIISFFQDLDNIDYQPNFQIRHP